jgi:ATP-binding cassette subfamily F protein 3
MASVEALVQALKEYEGTLCFISHDLYFVNSLADHILHVEGGKVTLYPGNYEYFQHRLAQKAEEQMEETPAPAPVKPKPTASPTFTSPQLTAADRDKMKENQKNQDKKRRKLNADIRELEGELLHLTTKQASIFVQSDYQKLMELDKAIKQIEKELSEAKEELTKLA